MLGAYRSRKAEKKAKKAAERDKFTREMEEFSLSVLGKPLGVPGSLGEKEKWWCKHYEWLQGLGYLLRARYAPGWTPSWQGTSKYWFECEDGVIPMAPQVLDATRLSDGKPVTLKIISKSRHPLEVEIGRFFSGEPLASDPANHCVPIFDVFKVPDDDDLMIIVMPALLLFYRPPFDTFGEVVECIRQLLEGLQFMHKHYVAHRDCMDLNIMTDGTVMFPEPYHPSRPRMRLDMRGYARHFTRTQRPPKYYFIDFGISCRFDPSNGPPLEVPIRGGDKTVPELQDCSHEPRDPFPTDIYFLGNAFREHFTATNHGFEFLEQFVLEMIQTDLSKRPTADELVSRFEIIRKGLSSWKLRSRVIPKHSDIVEHLTRAPAHWARRIGFVAKGVSPLPSS